MQQDSAPAQIYLTRQHGDFIFSENQFFVPLCVKRTGNFVQSLALF